MYVLMKNIFVFLCRMHAGNNLMSACNNLMDVNNKLLLEKYPLHAQNNVFSTQYDYYIKQTNIL